MAITWKDCIKLADSAIEELKQLMNQDPARGVLYQQEMAIMMLRKVEAFGAMCREDGKRYDPEEYGLSPSQETLVERWKQSGDDSVDYLRFLLKYKD